MQSIFEKPARESVLSRLDRLEAGSNRHWGKMNPAQMLTHCSLALEVACGDKPKQQAFLGKILTPFIRSSILGEKPFSKNSPTDPTFVVSDERDFATEKQRLAGIVERFCKLGPDSAAKQTHSFFGRLSGDEWGRLMYKHLDHHLQQFGV